MTGIESRVMRNNGPIRHALLAKYGGLMAALEYGTRQSRSMTLSRRTGSGSIESVTMSSPDLLASSSHRAVLRTR